MNRAALVLLLACCTSVFIEGCGSARKARKARKLEAARRADSIAAIQRHADSLLTESAEKASPSPDTVETAALGPAKSPIPSFILAEHGLPRGFRTFSGKAKVEYEGSGQSLDATIVIRLRRDSAIWASVVAVGGAIPVARIVVTPDSVLYVNFLKREGARMGAQDAVTLLPVPLEFSQLQAVLLGEVQSPRAAIASTGKAEVSDVYYIATRGPAASYISYYNAGDSSLIGEEARAIDGSSFATAHFRMFETVAGKKFPLQREINLAIPGPDSTLRHAVLLTFIDPPRFDPPLEFSFSIPNNYTLK
jgi:hypothetical protein